METTTQDLELKVLFEISTIMGQVLNLDQALEAILGVLANTLAMKRATLTLRDDETGHLAIRASQGLSTEEKKRGVYRLDEGVTGLIFRTNQPFVVPDIRKEPLFLDKTQARRIEKGRISFLGVPINHKNTIYGVLSVDKLFGEEVSFEEDIRFLTIVGTLISQFISLNHQIKAREESLRRENFSLRTKLSDKYRRFFIVGKSQPMIQIQQIIEKVAPTKATVLLLGESGTGKTLISRIIHELSDRATFPFIKVNCAALPDNLLESELFGYERGAFTGAVSSKPGRFEEADKGTIFLDEIGELSPGIQAKLLRFLQEKEFERLGANRTIKVDVRILAATNKDLSEAVKSGRFRDDLFYRLNVFPIRVPSLRERRDDIPALLGHFLDKVSREYGRRLSFTPASVEALVEHDWPGNVREMENLIERLSIMVEGDRIDITDLPVLSHPKSEALDAATTAIGHLHLRDVERREVLAALERNRWIQSRAARDLGLTARQMGYKVKKFNLDNLIKAHRRGDYVM